jgi:hypothetical protein
MARYPGFKDTIKPTSAFMHVRKADYKDLLSLNNDYYTLQESVTRVLVKVLRGCGTKAKDTYEIKRHKILS